MTDNKNPLDLPPELQHLIEKRSGEERRDEGDDNETAEYSGPDRRQAERRQAENDGS